MPGLMAFGFVATARIPSLHRARSVHRSCTEVDHLQNSKVEHKACQTSENCLKPAEGRVKLAKRTGIEDLGD